MWKLFKEDTSGEAFKAFSCCISKKVFPNFSLINLESTFVSDSEIICYKNSIISKK